MAGTIGRSLELLEDTWRVLMMDKELLLFPVLSGIAILAILVSFIFPLILLEVLGSSPGLGPLLFFLLLFLFYFLTYAVTIFFTTGLVACAAIRFSGGDPTVRDGLSAASRHLGKILAWALIAATVGLVLSLLSRRSGILGKIVISLVGMAWSLATFLVIPVMIFEEKGVLDAIQESGSLLRKTWGENLIGTISLAILFVPSVLFLLLAFAALFSGSITLVLTLFATAIICLALSGILHATLQGIFIAALYQYAKTGRSPGQFQGEIIQGAFVREEAQGGLI